MQLPPFLKLPLEILDLIMILVPTHEDAIRLSRTCTALRANDTLLKSTYREIIARYDIPVTSEDVRYGISFYEFDGSPAWKHFCVFYKPRYDLRFQSINARTGPYVEAMAMYEWATPTRLLQLATHCPKLRLVDFTGLSESIDLARHVWVTDDEARRFSWRVMLERCPSFFAPLQVASLNYAGEDAEDGIPRPGLLPLFLQMTPNLEQLEIRHIFDDLIGRYYYMVLMSVTQSMKLQQEILRNAGEKLHTIIFYHAHGLTRNLELFLEPFTALNALKSIGTSLYHDLMLTETPFNIEHDPAGLMGFDKVTQSPLRHVIAAKKASEYGNWKFISTDEGDRYPSNPGMYSDLAKPENLQYMEWLTMTVSWNPLFDWSDYLFVKQQSVKISNTDIPPARRLFKEMKKGRFQSEYC